MSFDTLTVLMLLVVGNIFVFIFLIFYIFSSKLKNPLLITYSLGKLVLFSAYILLAYRSVFPEYFSIIVGNTLIFLGIAMEVFCIISVWKRFSRRRFVYFVLPTFIFALVFSGFIKASDPVRIAIATVHPALYLLYGSISLIFSRRKSVLSLFMGLLYFITALSCFGRLYVAVFVDNSIHLYSDNGIQLIFYMLLFFMIHIGAIYLLISLKEQDEEKILTINKIIKNDNVTLKELNQVKNKFFSIIAHDLKTPVGTLHQLLGVLIEKSGTMDSAHREKILGTLHDNSKSTYHLLNNLLLWARSESGRMKQNPRVIKIGEAIKENISLFQVGAENKNIEISNHAKDIAVFADYDMVNFVLRNLLSNAIKFTQEKGSIQITASENGGENVVVGVEDTGIGLGKEVIPRLFDLDSEYAMRGTNKESGTGLGLKLCKEFVEKNKGKIWVESSEGKGSKFFFTLPAYK